MTTILRNSMASFTKPTVRKSRSAKGPATIGESPAAEEAEEGFDEPQRTVIYVVHSFRLNEINLERRAMLIF